MAVPAYLFDQGDLERAVGGAPILVQLLDRNRDGIADTDGVLAVREEASGEALSYLNVAIDVAHLPSPLPRHLVLKAAAIGAYHAFVRGTTGQAMPEWVVNRYKDAVAWFQAVGRREATLATAPPPPASQDVLIVDPDPLGAGISRSGFSKGFR